ncbi:hypothetical protein [Campylobacter coli]|uniref:hypothetical protein n=1 Tax=Campylobacter coli TaxID=195 RepID=UPI001F188052|nr:hypothetical protein [Campylobacter coli]
MHKINVVCFGSCDMYPTYGFVGGIKDIGSKVISFGESFNGVHSVLYHLLRKENKNIVNNADLFVVGITETTKETACSDMEMYKIFYKKLSDIGEKVVIIIMPHATTDSDFYGNFHQNQCEFFGFNLIDIKHFCIENEIYEFYTKYYDSRHPFYSFMSGISKRVVENYEKLQYPKKNNQMDNFNFEIYPIKEFVSEDMFRCKKARTFTTYENIIEIPLGSKIKFPISCIGKKLVGIHMFNGFIGVKDISKFSIENKDQKFLLQTPPYNRIVQISENFVIDDQSYICAYSNDSAKIIHPLYRYAQTKETNLGIVAFFLSENKKISFEVANTQNFRLSQEYDFAYLLNFLIEGKNFIEDYNKKQDIIRINPLQNQITTLINEKLILKDRIDQLQNTINSLSVKRQQLEISNLKQDLTNRKLQTKQLSKKSSIKMSDFMSRIAMVNSTSAKTRIQNQLSYKLGQAMIVNSKSLLGYIRMPFALSYIKDKHKQEQKIYQEKIKKDPSLKLPPLEDYPDYKEALKEKECLTYKLGEALIKASNNWYGGGVYQIIA